MTLYQLDKRHISGDGAAYVTWIVNRLLADDVLVPVEPSLYVERWGGLAESFYRCDKDEADGAVFNINLLRGGDEQG